jgi:hypothetical protein
MTAWSGTPDWQGSFRIDNFTLLPAYGRNDLFLFFPRVALLAKKNDKTPDFSLEFVSDFNASRVEDSLYATINIGLTREVDTGSVYRRLTELYPAGAMIPATFAPDTRWHIESGDLHETQPFAWEEAERARILQRVPTTLGTLIYGALAKGSATVLRSAIECEIPSFLPRVEATVTFDTGRLLGSLTDLERGSRNVPLQRVTNFFSEPHPGLLSFEGQVSSKSTGDLALALSGRVRHFLGGPAPCLRIGDGPFIALREAGQPLPAITRWDLRTPLMTTVPVFLDFDPFTQIVNQGGRDSVTKISKIPPLPLDRLTERVTIGANLPPNIQTHDQVDLTLLVSCKLSLSGLDTRELVTLYPADGKSNQRELKFKRSQPKTYEIKIEAVSESNILDSGWSDRSGDYIYVGPETLPGTCVTVRGTAPLLEQTKISAVITGGAEKLAVTISEQQPAATFLLGEGYENARLAVTAQDVTNASKILNLDFPCRSLSLDLVAFSQYGPHTVHVTVKFDRPVPSADFEFQPESGSDDPIILSFTPAAPSGDFGYFATNIFRAGYRYRRRPTDADPQPQWSGYQLPGEPLTVHVP